MLKKWFCAVKYWWLRAWKNITEETFKPNNKDISMFDFKDISLCLLFCYKQLSVH